ncbi:MAG: quercetin 2,3-dioxygenase [Bdellovibrio sp. ArHS]|uniref:pirin family protein n=1 Tax=Bdellovibrio sp. ArHS TaxID=1569284 RepID=UPI000583715E|nr:pirin family protein [Bdellovibrio sp. ArHS]KHD87590.1 MAG: quercetin 2,3-dioxygenase [Bdellovibrio sp. ArHS]
MFALRKSNERGFADHGWLKSRHTFSFADYYDPDHMGFRALRVINEDRIEGGTGFGMHGHRDMEIISYVVQGALEHKDSKGNVAVIKPGDVQRMSAGTGVMHSEYNKMPESDTHFFQIWILPDRPGTSFGYGQKSFADDLNTKDLVLVVSKEGREGSISINQDADLYISRMKKGKEFAFPIRPSRHVWLQVIQGHLNINGHVLETGDAVKVSQEQSLQVSAQEDSEFMLFDLA